MGLTVPKLDELVMVADLYKILPFAADDDCPGCMGFGTIPEPMRGWDRGAVCHCVDRTVLLDLYGKWWGYGSIPHPKLTEWFMLPPHAGRWPHIHMGLGKP